MFNKLFMAVFTIALALSLTGPIVVFAATDPGLGAAASFSIIGQTAITNVPTSVISGSVGLNAAGTNYAGLNTSEVAGTIYDTNGTGPDGATAILPANVQANLSTAYTTNIPGQGTNGSIGPVLDGLTVTPGVWDIGAGRLNGGVLTLDGAGIYIFRATSDLISSGSINLTNGARACDVYWRVQTLATINGSSFTGTILAGTGVHFGANVTLNGRALAVGGDVTLISDTISGPTCAGADATINVVKTVVNDSGRSNVIGDFPLFVSGTPVVSGVTNVFAPGTYTVTETSDSNYTRSFSGDCNSSGVVTLGAGENKFCIITNNDTALSAGEGTYTPTFPPLISVVKVPTPLALPSGPGSVTYTYTVNNIGVEPMTNVTLVGDTCSPINLASGDTNADTTLDLTETWIYTCSTTLSATHTNTVVATGWANGISATDIASATVVVGIPVIPPLIHVTKIPNPLKLPAGGGMVTYTEKITNPGAVALSNVTLTDDKCGPMNYISGDINNDSKLDTTETWTYTCPTNLTQTTTNTATATGQANGLTIRDFAIATVVVAPQTPTLPNTGFPPTGIQWAIVIFAGILIVASVLIILSLRKRTT